MEKIFYNTNGNVYYVLFGGKGEKSFLCNVNREQYVICKILKDYSWYYGQYFENFEQAYEVWQEKYEYIY